MTGTALTAASQLEQGKALEQEGEFTARQLERKANLVKASSQRGALEIERQGKLEQSRALAVAAASGGGASDPTVINHMAQLAGETNYRKMVSLYEGEEQAQQLMGEARAARRGGKSARRTSRLQAITTVLSGGTSLYSKYGAS